MTKSLAARAYSQMLIRRIDEGKMTLEEAIKFLDEVFQEKD